MARYRVSQEVLGRLQTLAGLAPSVVQALVEALHEKASIQLSPESAIKDIVEGFEPLKELSAEARSELVSSVLFLHAMRYSSGRSVSDLVADVKEAAEKDASYAKERLSQLELNLSAVLGIASIQGSIKAWTLLTEHDRIYLESRVITDLRPIFDEELSKPLQASLVVHTIKITVRRDGKREQLYIGADAADLDELRDQIERALKKGAVLKAIIQGDPSKGFGKSLGGEDE